MPASIHDLPAELLEKILIVLPAYPNWVHGRLVSSRWAAAVRSLDKRPALWVGRVVLPAGVSTNWVSRWDERLKYDLSFCRQRTEEELRQKVIERRALYDADEYDDEDEDWYRICNIWERKVPVKVLEPRLCDSMLSAEERQFLSEMGGPARGR